MSELRALLLTDVVDSTRHAAALGDTATGEIWAAHDRAARKLLRLRRGHEIERTDGLAAVFESAADAAGFAIDYHLALAELNLPFQARAGIHFGPIELRPNSADDVAVGAKHFEMNGLAISIATRVMATALGGQTLLTEDARAAVGVSALNMRSHGHWRLKGLDRPIELFEVADSGSPVRPPPDGEKAYRVFRKGELWLPVREIKHNIPAERDKFIGRRHELGELARSLERGARLISVLGTGGAGKTRFVTHFAWVWLGDFPGGVWFCDLSQARSLDGVAFAVAQGLDVPLGRIDPVVQLAHAIAGRGKCLVILDNFEQVSRHASDTLGVWLERAPDARFIATTREVLGVVGEETFALATLPSDEAVALFMTRAESAKREFRAEADERAVVEALVRVLDALPLAIELAAARVRVMTPRMLLANMNDRFAMLRSRGGRPDRQSTLKAALDWSWDLLAEPEKSTLAQISVFEGGFTIESSGAVVDLSGYEDAPGAIDLLHSLIDKSLVREAADDRFDLLESIREYANEHLRTEGRFRGSGPSGLSAAERRHGIFFASLGPKRAVAHACVELDNLVVACRRAAMRADAEIAANALAGAWGALKLRGPFRVGIEMSRLVQNIPSLPPVPAAAVGRILGSALMHNGQTAEARSQLESIVQQSARPDGGSVLPYALASLAELSMREGRIDEALEHFEQALAGSSKIADPSFECGVLSGLGACNEYLGRFDSASQFYQRTLVVARESGERRWEGGALGNLGQLCANHGRTAEAQRHYELALAIADELGDRQWGGNVRCNLGLLHHGDGRSLEAIRYLDLALISARELGYPRLESVVLCNLGIVLEAQGNFALACERHSRAVELARSLGDRRSEGQFLGYLGLLHARQRRFGDAKRCIENGAGLLRAVADRFSLGVLLCAQVEAAHLMGNALEAERLFDEVERMAREVGAEPTSEFGASVTRVRGLFAGAVR